MLSGFKQFVLRGNVVDLAVGVVIGAAFGTVVTALVKDIINPIIALVVGKPDFTGISFTIGTTLFRSAISSPLWSALSSLRRRFTSL
jgi:large conductance mechanosensitive channel